MILQHHVRIYCANFRIPLDHLRTLQDRPVHTTARASSLSLLHLKNSWMFGLQHLQQNVSN
jgi:hypothetical protein